MLNLVRNLRNLIFRKAPSPTEIELAERYYLLAITEGYDYGRFEATVEGLIFLAIAFILFPSILAEYECAEAYLLLAQGDWDSIIGGEAIDVSFLNEEPQNGVEVNHETPY